LKGTGLKKTIWKKRKKSKEKRKGR